MRTTNTLIKGYILFSNCIGYGFCPAYSWPTNTFSSFLNESFSEGYFLVFAHPNYYSKRNQTLTLYAINVWQGSIKENSPSSLSLDVGFFCSMESVILKILFASACYAQVPWTHNISVSTFSLFTTLKIQSVNIECHASISFPMVVLEILTASSFLHEFLNKTSIQLQSQQLLLSSWYQLTIVSNQEFKNFICGIVICKRNISPSSSFIFCCSQLNHAWLIFLFLKLLSFHKHHSFLELLQLLELLWHLIMQPFH